MKNYSLKRFISVTLSFCLVLGAFTFSPIGRITAEAAGEPSEAVPLADIAVRNYITGIDDKITVSNLNEGDFIKAYDAAADGNLLGSVYAVGDDTAVAVITNFASGQLGPGAGTVYITRTSPDMGESDPTAVPYNEEPIPWLIYDHTVNQGEDIKHSNFATGQTNSRYSGGTLTSHTPAPYPAYPAYSGIYDDSVDQNTMHNKHIIVKDNGARVTFYGYGVSPYKDFMFLPSNNTASRTVSFDFDLSSVSFHTLEGAGFLFNTKLESGGLYGYAVLFTGAVDGNNNEILNSRAIKLYKLNNVNPTTLNNSTSSNLSGVSGVSQLSPTVYAAGAAIGNVHHVTLQISPSSFTMIDTDNGDPSNGHKMIDNFTLPTEYGNGIGFISSYLSHQCSVLSYITFNHVVIQGSTWPILDLTATSSNGRGKVDLIYSRPEDAEVVVIQQSTNGGATYTTAETEQPVQPGDNSVTVTGLTNGVDYTFRVLVGGGVNEGISNTAAATPNGTQSAAPVAVNDTYSVTGGNTLSVPAGGILLNDTDAEDDPLTAVSFSAISDSSKGVLTTNANGSFTFAAAENASGSVTFTYKASDGTSQSNTATVTINITPLRLDVAGTVIDRDTSQPISGATVILYDLSGNEIDSVATDANGNYVIPNVVVNRYNLEVDSPAYSKSHREITVSKASDAADGNADGTLTEDFALVGYEITLTANPSSILGNGTSSSNLTAVVVDHDGNPQAGVTVTFSVPNITDGHFSNSLASIDAMTDANGRAVVVFTSGVLGGLMPQSVPVTAAVDDDENDLHASDTIYITFTPGVIAGVVTDNQSNPVAGATVEISKDFDHDGIVDFHAVAVTGVDGTYSIAIPKGEETYITSITKPVNIGGTPTSVTFTQNVTVSNPISGMGETFDSNKTASGVVMIPTSQGAVSVLDGSAGYAAVIVDGGGAEVGTGTINANGVFNVDSIPPGSYTVKIIYNIPLPGSGTAPVVIGHAGIMIGSNGQIAISEVLIDPYGTITDSSTNQPISGVTVTLHYDDGTTVTLPPLPGFPPADNANPQTSDASGQYAFMVFPNEDYYITAEKTGYKSYNSYEEDGGYIHVGTEIVQYDFRMTKLPDSGGGSTTTITAADPVDLAAAILSDKMKAGEGDTVTFTIVYANKTVSDADGVYVKAIFPSSMSVMDANGGVVSGNEIKWSLGLLDGGKKGTLTFKLKVNPMGKSEDFATVTATIGSDKKLAIINPQDDTSLIKLLLYSNQYEHRHERYIKGYPDGTVRPEKPITRAEIAAIFARTLNLQGEVQHNRVFNDVDPGYWGAEYIETVAQRGIFKGYEDQTFRPDKPITRAELAVAIARYLGVAKEARIDNILKISPFTDISGNWAEQPIEEIFRFGIVSGYEDGSFHSGSPITREEAFKMINGMLYRGPLTGTEPSYPDNHTDKWSFGQVEETTRTHIFKLNKDGSEIMTEFIPEPLW